MIYLASPWTHPDPTVRHERLVMACRAAVALAKHGHVVFSPIAHSVTICEYGGAPDRLEYWLRQDLAILRCCARLVILMLDGWRESKGIKEELEQARGLNLQVSYVEPINPTLFLEKPKNA